MGPCSGLDLVELSVDLFFSLLLALSFRSLSFFAVKLAIFIGLTLILISFPAALTLLDFELVCRNVETLLVLKIMVTISGHDETSVVQFMSICDPFLIFLQLGLWDGRDLCRSHLIPFNRRFHRYKLDLSSQILDSHVHIIVSCQLGVTDVRYGIYCNLVAIELSFDSCCFFLHVNDRS